MKRICLLVVGIIGLLVCAQGVRAESAHRLGVGANYWRMLDDVDMRDIDKNGISWLATYQYKIFALLKLEADLEVFPNDFQGLNSAVYAPEAYVVLGSTIYAAVGIGIFYEDNEFAPDPFYALRAGLDLEILPKIYLDLNVNYRFTDWVSPGDMTRDINADTLMLGAAVRYEF